jgi:cyanophycinase-like exopeptidase
MDRGLAYAGCSGGVACLGQAAIDSTVADFDSPDLWKPALALFPRTYFGVHWDALDRYVPGLQAMFTSAVPAGSLLVGIDERTAMVGDGTAWSVFGSGSASLVDGGELQTFPEGSAFSAPLMRLGTVERLPAAIDPDTRPAS